MKEDLQESDGKSREQPTPELQNTLAPAVVEVWVERVKQHAGKTGTIQR